MNGSTDRGPFAAPPVVPGGGLEVAWEGPREEGLASAWWQTVREISFKPGQALRGVAQGDVRKGLAFGVATQSIGMVLYLPFHFGMQLMDPALSEEERGLLVGVGAVMIAGLPLWVALGLALNSAGIHPFLKMMGGQGTLGDTLVATSYASAPVAFYAVPCFGWMIGSALTIVTSVYAQKHAHDISGPRVVGAWALMLAMALSLLGMLTLLAVGAG